MTLPMVKNWIAPCGHYHQRIGPQRRTWEEDTDDGGTLDMGALYAQFNVPPNIQNW